MVTIEKMLSKHWQQVKEIYEDGIKTGNATFEATAPEWEAWDKAHLKECRLVDIEDDKILGWAALVPVSSRCVYAGVAENSVYVSSLAQGKGIGKMLLSKLVAESEAHNIWTIQTGIFPENIASIKIHEAVGFRLIGKRERIGKMNGVWRDTLFLERRSNKVGI